MISTEFAALRNQFRDSSLPRELGELRRVYDAMGSQTPVPIGTTPSEGMLGGCPCRWFKPTGIEHSAVVLYLHGGGYSIGSSASHLAMGPGISTRTGAAVVLLDYRLAPEHLFPAAVEDAFAAYAELLRTYAPGQIAVSGDSAGGGLAVALIVRISDSGLPQPACVYSMSPWANLGVDSEYLNLKAAQDVVTNAEILRAMAATYLGSTDPRHPQASPIYADLHDAPPMLIQVGSAEVLLGDSLQLAEKLARADRNVRLGVWPEMIHTWQTFYPMIPEGRAALDEGCRFLQLHLKS
jgi:epsilon-lactone hydrolase